MLEDIKQAVKPLTLKPISFISLNNSVSIQHPAFIELNLKFFINNEANEKERERMKKAGAS